MSDITCVSVLFFFIPRRTILKIDLTGSNYMPLLLEDMTFENIPERFGGGFKLYNEPFHFDKSPGGPLFCGPVDRDGSSELNNQKQSHFFPSSDPSLEPERANRPERRLSLQTPSSSGSNSPTRDYPDTWNSVSSKQSFDRVSSTSSVASSLTDPETPPRASLSQGSGGAARTAASLLFSRINNYSSSNNQSNLASSQGYARNSVPPSNGRPLTSIAERRAHPHSLNDLRLDTELSNTFEYNFHDRPEFDQREATVQRNSGLSPTTSRSDAASLKANRGAESKSSRENSFSDGSPGGNPYSPCLSTTEKSEFILFLIVRAVGAEFYEFLSTLYLLLTQHPLKTVLSGAVVGAFLYLRMQDRLHLMVFPVVALATLLYFEKIR